jgi:hypothetical protein
MFGNFLKCYNKAISLKVSAGIPKLSIPKFILLIATT